MAELLVRIIDKVNDDPYLDVHCTKRGDVIVVRPDGWAWGQKEINNPEWRIVKLQASVSECLQFLSPELPQSATPDRMVRKRAFMLDIDLLDAGEVKVEKLIVRKARMQDPNVFGDDKRVFG